MVVAVEWTLSSRAFFAVIDTSGFVSVMRTSDLWTAVEDSTQVRLQVQLCCYYL